MVILLIAAYWAQGLTAPLTTGGTQSERVDQVLRLMAQGYSIKEIGVKIGVSQKTVETYKCRFFKKLQLDSRADVMRYAIENGWLHESL